MTVIACDPFEFKKRRQLFIRLHNETLSIAACVMGTEALCKFVLA
jgi:hypothetical protein